MTGAPLAPRVSVVMSVWNGERYLAEAIDSVLAQTYDDFELVIVDDGSSDMSPEIVASYAAGDARVRPIYGGHHGLVSALNEGCLVARGALIARIDADDVAMPERLALQVAFMEAHRHVSLIGGAVQFMDPAGRHWPAQVAPCLRHEDLRDRLANANCFIHSTIMMRRDAWLQVGGYRALCADAEDYDLWTRFADHHELAGMKEVLARYRVHPLQVSVTRMERMALVSLVISLATRLRWQTGVDPLAECVTITRETARGLGARDDDIEMRAIRAYLDCLGGLQAFGIGEVVLTVLRELATNAVLMRAIEERYPGSTATAILRPAVEVTRTETLSVSGVVVAS